MGATVESVTSELNHQEWSASRLIDPTNPVSGVAASEQAWSSAPSPAFPQEIIFSFLNREPALVSQLVLRSCAARENQNYGGRYGPTRAEGARDVEIWTSMESPTAGFSKVADLAVPKEPGVDRSVSLGGVEARYIKVRILSNYGAKDWVVLGRVRAFEGQRAGYPSLLARNPEFAALVAPPRPDTGPTPGQPVGGEVNGATPAGAAVPPGASPDRCQPFAPVKVAAAHSESRNVLVLLRHQSGSRTGYPPIDFKPTDSLEGVDHSIYGRIKFTVVWPGDAKPSMLLRAAGIDTVAIGQICDIQVSVSAAFKRALINWLGQGHKLIVHDSDQCGAYAEIPDYGFLPYRFATSNPGAMGAPGTSLSFVEENTLANGVVTDPGFLDIASWVAGTKGNHNELGDTNTVKAWDPRWCGHLFGTNVLKVNGFMEAYTHIGRGLLIYDGMDKDQRDAPAYRQLVTRELAQPFDPDGLPCSARLGDFVITTDERLKTQWTAPGHTYVYPLTLLSNRGYKGTVKLSAAATPTEPAVSVSFDPDTVDVTEMSKTRLTVTTGAGQPVPRRVAVRGTDANGTSNTLCLQLAARKTGGLQVVSGLSRARKPTRNLEIILDLSGSMKLRLGNGTRIGTARQVLTTVVGRIPDDFNVGLRLYGHRYASTQKETCTDSELVVPIQKLDRARVLATVEGAKPRGETPLVYSVLQAVGDLKATGGGSVILITDGEESCHGDPVAAARQIKASGLDLTLSIVGFTLTGQQVQRDLAGLAQSTGGRYYAAQDGDTLARALLMAAVDRLPYTVVDAAGATVARGEAGGPANELPPGDYKVVVLAADQQIVVEHVKVTQNADVVLTIVAKGDRFAIER